MPSNKSVSAAPITQFINCRILKDHLLQREDLIIAPGFIDVQINGGYGIDFSQATDDVNGSITQVAKKILEHGVTSFCPTLVTSPSHIYHKVLPKIKVRDGGVEGAGVLGVHLEGPFISLEKKGAHPEKLPNSQAVIRELTQRGITVSLGHSVASLSQAEDAVQHGATFITHLFNAMLPFHHRDPGIVGLLTSDRVPANRRVYYGMIADGIHTNPAALRIAHRAHPAGLVLVTDAITAMGLPPGRHTLGQQVIEIEGFHAYVAGTKTLSGSIATMDMCIRHFREASGCTVEAALEAASAHPAQLLGLSHRKGTLDYGTDADFVLLDDELNVKATYIGGQEVWRI
ncbi:hypothetical protein AGOR_G00230030 [Albula goreensis]|uniref:N-acetylglucosamine-6-phosphate deacetylase n=1 Tax=Albula goreensis TaxID=1534307 RepID=A0A8T3CLR8_9TELE|nr:hypothetical protein AGOR_G00230030 [Albula goreensis]